MGKFSEFMRYFRLGRGRLSDDARESERHSILSQERTLQKPAERPKNRRSSGKALPATARLGFLGLAAVVMWLSWPRVGDLALTLFPQGSADDVALAMVNPANVPALRVTRGPEIIPVDNETEESSRTDALDAIIVVTPTPGETDNAGSGEDIAVEPASTHDSPVQGPVGLILAGEQVPISDSNPEATVDPALLSDMLAPLLEEQINPTPLVIDLEIPAGDAVRSSDGLGGANLRAPSGRSGAFPQIMLLPTATPTSDPFRDIEAPAGIPSVEIVPAVGVKYTPTPTPAPTATPLPQPTALWAASGPTSGRLWSSFAPLPPDRGDHFWIGNPFAEHGANGMPSPNYQFGSTAGGRYRPHHGVDISNPSGTPVEAGVVGEVVFAGADDSTLLGPYNNFYGNAVVIRLDQRLPVAGGQLDVYVLYGHLSEVRASAGQEVQPSDVVGLVGMTGIAIGPHLHVEARLGANTYSHSVNPYLWMQPRAGTGAVAVRLLTADGKTWAGAKLSIARFEGGKAVWARQIETYLDTENIGPDPAWGENGAMGDVPAGYYYLIGRVNGESIRAEFPVNAGETSFVEIRTQQ